MTTPWTAHQIGCDVPLMQSNSETSHCVPEIFSVTSGLVTQDLASTRQQSNDTFYSLQNLCSVTALVQGGQIDEVLTAASLIN